MGNAAPNRPALTSNQNASAAQTAAQWTMDTLPVPVPHTAPLTGTATAKRHHQQQHRVAMATVNAMATATVTATATAIETSATAPQAPITQTQSASRPPCRASGFRFLVCLCSRLGICWVVLAVLVRVQARRGSRDNRGKLLSRHRRHRGRDRDRDRDRGRGRGRGRDVSFGSGKRKAENGKWENGKWCVVLRLCIHIFYSTFLGGVWLISLFFLLLILYYVSLLPTYPPTRLYIAACSAARALKFCFMFISLNSQGRATVLRGVVVYFSPPSPPSLPNLSFSFSTRFVICHFFLLVFFLRFLALPLPFMPFFTSILSFPLPTCPLCFSPS